MIIVLVSQFVWLLLTVRLNGCECIIRLVPISGALGMKVVSRS